MQEIIAPVLNIKFDIEVSIEHQIGALPLPFPGMDKSGAAICTYYLGSVCNKGTACPFRHVRQDRTVVCKHWLRGLCKKGDDCEFLHEFDMSKMPECYFFSKFGGCANKDCPFLHIDPENKIKDCPWYDRGFCRHGPLCKNRHVRRVVCQCYLNGFCLDGPNCKYVHPRFDIPAPDPQQLARKMAIVCHLCGNPGHKAAACHSTGQMPSQQSSIVCHVCGNSGHKAAFCPTRSISTGFQQNQSRDSGIVCHLCGNHGHKAAYCPINSGSTGGGDASEAKQPRRPMDQVTCYKCGEKGHYANRCPKGHLAFLSPLAGTHQHQGPPPQMGSAISSLV